MVQPDIIVRKVTPSDLKLAEEAALVINQAYRSKGGWTTEEDIVSGERCTKEDMEKFISTSGTTHTLFFAVEHQTIVGTAQIEVSTKNPTEASLGLFSVSPLKQSRGIGRQLVNAALSEMKELGMTHAAIYVLENRPEILAWYNKLGFEYTGEGIPFIWPEKLIQPTPLRLLVLKKSLE